MAARGLRGSAAGARNARVRTGLLQERRPAVGYTQRPSDDASAGWARSGSAHRARIAAAVAAWRVRRVPLGLFAALLGPELFFRLGNQLLDLLTALVTDFLVEVGAIFFLDDLAAFLTDALVELDPMPLAGRLASLAADLFVKARSIAVPDRIAAFFAGLTYRHLATWLLVVRLAFGGFCHEVVPGLA